MSEEEEPKRAPRPILAELVREDLEPRSLEELGERIACLERELVRTKEALAVKSALRGAAASLFKR